jgi:hypothetical protein
MANHRHANSSQVALVTTVLALLADRLRQEALRLKQAQRPSLRSPGSPCALSVCAYGGNIGLSHFKSAKETYGTRHVYTDVLTPDGA